MVWVADVVVRGLSLRRIEVAVWCWSLDKRRFWSLHKDWNVWRGSNKFMSL